MRAIFVVLAAVRRFRVSDLHAQNDPELEASCLVWCGRIRIATEVGRVDCSGNPHTVLFEGLKSFHVYTDPQVNHFVYIMCLLPGQMFHSYSC